MYKATNKETGEVTEMTEAHVRAEIVQMFGTILERSRPTKIVAGVASGGIEVYFIEMVCEVTNYKIAIA